MPVKEQIARAFLKLSKDTPAGESILKALGANAYVPANDNEFTNLKKTAQQLGLLEKTIKYAVQGKSE